MEYKIIELGEIAVIGKEGFCSKDNNIVSQLWSEANSHFDEVADIGMKEKDGSYVGFWGVMSDETMSYKPWTDGFSTGYYLAGIEVYKETAVPEGWKKWVMPARKYLVTNVNNDIYGAVFNEVINNLIPSLGLHLSGAVCDYTRPKDGQNQLFFPVKKGG